MKKWRALTFVGNLGYLISALVIAVLLGVSVYRGLMSANDPSFGAGLQSGWVLQTGLWTGLAGTVCIFLSAYAGHRIKKLTKPQEASNGKP